MANIDLLSGFALSPPIERVVRASIAKAIPNSTLRVETAADRETRARLQQLISALSVFDAFQYIPPNERVNLLSDPARIHQIAKSSMVEHFKGSVGHYVHPVGELSFHPLAERLRVDQNSAFDVRLSHGNVFGDNSPDFPDDAKNGIDTPDALIFEELNKRKAHILETLDEAWILLHSNTLEASFPGIIATVKKQLDDKSSAILDVDTVKSCVDIALKEVITELKLISPDGCRAL